VTWGQIRFQLLQSTPGIAHDLLDGWMNSRYEQVLEAGDWTGIHARATIETQAAYQSTTDSVTLTVGSATVTGAGTTWTNALIGQKFYRVQDNALYTVVGFTNATTLTLDRPYEGHAADAPGAIYAAAAYVFMQNVYTLPADCRSVERMFDATYEYPMRQLTPGEFDASNGPLTKIGDPQVFCEIEDQAEVIGTAPLHQVQLSPAPRYARGHIVEYLRYAFNFNGLNLTQSPLPFVSQSVIVYGVRADIAMHQNKIQQAAAYESKFKEELARLLLVEHSQRRAKPTLRMASRFTRHRVARVTRGYASDRNTCLE
jgi:hypothetical protein